MSTVHDWLTMAANSFEGARVCHEMKNYRSGISRAYYSMYQAATAICLHAGLTPRPDKCNWTHDVTAENFGNAGLKKLLGKRSIPLRQDTMRSYAARCDADYNPNARIDAKAGRDAMRFAGTFLRVAKEVIRIDHNID